MGTLVPSMQKGDLHQADICGMFLLFFFFTPLKNMQAKKNTTGLVPLGIFVFSEAVMFHFGSSYLLASVFPGAAAWTWLQRLWLVCPPTSPAQPSGWVLLGGPCSTCPCLAGREELLPLFLLLLIFPLCFSHQLPMTACNNSSWPLPAALVLWALHIFPFCLLPCITAVVESK